MANTPNLGLHQWNAGDSFLRTDFNEDFGKIDTAVDRATRVVKLKELTTTATAAQVDLDVADIDITAYRRIKIYVENICTESGTTIFLHLNNISAKESYYTGGNNMSNAMLSLGNPKDYPAVADISICGRNGLVSASATVYTYFDYFKCAEVFRPYGGVKPELVTPANLTTINFCSSSPILAGARFIIEGERI